MPPGLSISEPGSVLSHTGLRVWTGLPSVKIHCSILSEQSIKAAIYDYAQKNGLEFEGLKDFDPDAEDHDHDSCEIDGDDL